MQDFKSEIKLFLVVAAVSAVLAVGGVLLLQAGLGPSSPAPQTPPPAPALVPSPQPQMPDTAGWQTYYNEEFGFEVKYPSSLSLREFESSGDSQFIVFESEMVGKAVSIQVSVDNSANVDIVTWADDRGWPFSDDWRNHFDLTSIAGVQALRDPLTESVVFSANGYVYHISNGIGIDPELIERETFNQILATFRFVDSGKIILHKKDVWFADTLHGEVLLSSKDAVIDTTRSEELSCAYPTAGLKRYKGNFALEFRGKSLDLGEMEFVGTYAEFQVLRFPGDLTFIVISQHAGCNGRIYQVVGYTEDDLSIIPFTKEGKDSVGLYGYGVDVEEIFLTSSFYSQIDGLVHEEYYSWSSNENKFIFVKKESRPL